MINCTTIFAGLSETKAFWLSTDLLRYLLLLAGMDAVSGLYTANVIERCETFTLPRSGYARWYHRAMLGGGAVICLPLAVVAGIACLTSRDSVQTVALAAALLALNLLVVSNLQMFITLMTRNIALGYLVCMLMQLISVFCSEQLSPAGKMALLGNWGMLARSTLVQPDGISIGTAVGAEIVILLTLWIFAWRAVRKNRRGA